MAYETLIVEIEDSDICWTEPRDLRFDGLSFTADGDGKQSISSPHAKGPAVLFAYGVAAHIRPSLSAETWRALLTRDGGEDVSRKDVESR